MIKENKQQQDQWYHGPGAPWMRQRCLLQTSRKRTRQAGVFQLIRNSNRLWHNMKTTKPRWLLFGQRKPILLLGKSLFWSVDGGHLHLVNIVIIFLWKDHFCSRAILDSSL